MSEQVLASGFTAVDQAADPGSLVQYLGAVGALDTVRAYKQRSYALLGLRAGSVVLDAGCGTGDDARALAQLVAPGGSVVGIDASETMLDEAQRRLAGSTVALEFRCQDVHHLEFAAGTFDACRADRVLQHVEAPDRALRELARVAKPGGWIVVCEPDWDTLAIDSADRATTRAVIHAKCDSMRHGWMGRQLYRLFGEAGLVDVTVEPVVFALTDFAVAEHAIGLQDALLRAQAAELLPAPAAEAWWQGVKGAATAGRFFCALTVMMLAGRKL